jgi:ferritin-like metal-binding protein YciE
MQFNSLTDVLAEQIADLRSAEQQLIQALPKMADAANDPDLRDAFTTHLDETRHHAERLERVIPALNVTVPAKECEAMRGLVKEGEEVISAGGDPTARDTALIAAAQRVEHYEIAAYGTARTLAQELDLGDAADLLEDTLDEERKADSLLNKLATGGMMSSGLNEQATRS